MTGTRITRRNPNRYTPFGSMLVREVEELRDRARRFFEEPELAASREMEAPAFGMLGWSPAAEVSEDEREFLVVLELAGIRADDVKVDFDDGVLTVRGERTMEREEKSDDRRYHLWERSYGRFVRSFEFPAAVDEERISAESRDGELRVHLPKKPGTRAAARTIPVTAKAPEGARA